MDERVVSELAKETRRLRRIATGMLVVLVGMFALALYAQVRYWLVVFREPSPPWPSWKQATYSLDCQDFDTALLVAEELRDRNPDYHYAHTFLGVLYVARRELEKAERSFAKAYELFPIKKNREYLDAVQQLLGKTKSENP